MPRMALVVVILNLLLCVILCDKKEFILKSATIIQYTIKGRFMSR